MEFSTIGFVGVGAMGFHMAQQLVHKFNHSTFFVYDIDEGALSRFYEAVNLTERLQKCSSPKQVAEKAETVLVMVPEGSHAREVFLDTNTGILSTDVVRKLLIDCSTIDPASTRHIASEVKKRFPTAHFYDAPVSGGTMGASKGTLTFMLGCSDEDPELPRLKHLLGAMGSSIHACGEAGAGVTTKLCNNYLSGLIAIAASEAMNLGIRSGLDPRRLNDVFRTSTAQNAILDRFNPVPDVDPEALSSKGYEGGFKVQLMRKDFGLAVEAAKQVGARLALGEAGLGVYQGASEDEACRDRDSRVVYRYIGGVENWKTNMEKTGKPL